MGAELLFFDARLSETALRQREARHRASNERHRAVEDHLSNALAIATLLHETVDGDRFVLARSYLAQQLDKTVGALGLLLEG